MLLYLLRHAIAQESAGSDAARELTPEGVAQARAVVEKFRQYSPRMESVRCSPYVRAQQTASYVMPLFPGIEMISDEGLTPGGDIYDAIDVIETSAVQNLLLVGHNPFMSRMLSALIDGTVESRHYVGNACLYCISMDVVAPGCGKLLYNLNP